MFEIYIIHGLIEKNFKYRKFLYTIRTRIESPLELNPHRKIKILIESSLE